MTTLDEREQRTLSKRCSKCYETKPLEEFPPRKDSRDGRKSWCRVCRTKRDREATWSKKGIPESEWPRLHKEADRKAEAQAARYNSVPDGFKRCTRCRGVRSLAEFPPNKRRRDGRGSWCRGCDAKHAREARWAKRGIPPEEWPLLHARHALNENMRHLNAIFGGKWCPECEQHLPREYFHRASSSADGLRWLCKACESARNAAYSHTPAGRASRRGRSHRRRAKIQGLPTDGTGPRDWAAHAEEIEDFECHLCGGALEVDDEIHWDHLDPISTGTTGTVFHNMHAAHAECNLMRGNRSLEEWWAATGLLDVVV